jgi:hypothetical protein
MKSSVRLTFKGKVPSDKRMSLVLLKISLHIKLIPLEIAKYI